MMPALVLAGIALVMQDDTALRAAPSHSSPRQAVLAQWEALEVRGTRLGYLQVYDHRRERGGYVRESSVRQYAMQEEDAPALLAVVEFLKDRPGSESLGIAHAAMFLKAAQPKAINADVFDAIGIMADRLARHASARSAKPGDALAAHLDAASAYGVHFQSFDVEGRTRICYDGEAFRHVLALGGTEEQKARAALGLTRPECVDPAMSPVEQRTLDEWRAEVLDRVEPAKLPSWVAARLHVRRAATWAGLAYERMRAGSATESAVAANRALKELALVDKRELAEDDVSAYSEAAVRVGASRWAAEPVSTPAGGLSITTVAGKDGQTCIELIDGKHDAKAPLLERCTYGLVWSSSAGAAKNGHALALAVQPMAAWRELWIFHLTENGWALDVLTPATEPGVGYLEYAGWSPDGAHVLAVRESRVQGAFRKSFEVLNVETLAVEKHADSPGWINAFARWQAPDWKARTVAIR